MASGVFSCKGLGPSARVYLPVKTLLHLPRFTFLCLVLACIDNVSPVTFFVSRTGRFLKYDSVFYRTLLNLAVEHGWGGRGPQRRRQELYEWIIQTFLTSKSPFTRVRALQPHWYLKRLQCARK